MHIVFLLHDIHFGGGGERVTVNLANYLINKDFGVSIVSLAKSRRENIFKLDKRIVVDYLNFEFEKGFNIPKKIASVFAVQKHFRKYQDKTVALGIGTYPSLLLAFLPRRENIRTIGCQHNSYAAVKNIWSFLRQHYFNQLSALVSLTERDLTKLKKLNPKSFVIPNSVTFIPDQISLLKQKTILTIGRIDFPKGYDLLISMFEKLSLLQPDWKLKIVGDGPLKVEINSRIEKSGLKGKIEIIPPTDKIIDQYLDASVYVMTSRTEGLPMVLLEAQACGLPIVSFNCETGPSEIIADGENGYLIENFDVDAMVEKLNFLCSNPEKRTEFGKNGRENIKRFSPEVIHPKWEKLFDEVFQ